MMENLLDFIVGGGGGGGGRCMVSFIQNIHIVHTHTYTRDSRLSHAHNKFITFNFRAKRFFLSCWPFFYLVHFLFVHFSMIEKRASWFLHSKILFGFLVNISTFKTECVSPSSPAPPLNELNFG